MRNVTMSWWLTTMGCHADAAEHAATKQGWMGGGGGLNAERHAMFKTTNTRGVSAWRLRLAPHICTSGEEHHVDWLIRQATCRRTMLEFGREPRRLV
ncbi:hypothetical protein BC567DRAFT_222720 [Phyllosticta citribraziliensis]